MKRTFRFLSLGLAALGAVAASAATIPSPYRPVSSPAAAGRLGAEGQEGLDVDAAAVAALRNGSDAVVEIENFPVAPGASGTLRLTRFEVAAPDARITVRGAGGEMSLPKPKVSHFAGTIEG